MKAANSVSKMALAHEIAVDEDFHLEKVDPPSNSIQKKIKDIAHQAFWDLLKEELEQEEANYIRALSLLEEIKDLLLSLLLPHQTKTQQEIKDKIDLNLIRQQIEAKTLDMHAYSQYIVSLMGRLCAPARDEKIRELTALRDIVPLYQGIFETLGLMKLDMANFHIAISRPHIAACSAEYERAKFEDYLKVTPDGLRNTREWLYRNRKLNEASGSSTSSSSPHHAISSILVESFMELLTWDGSHPWPETVAMDEQRFTELRSKLRSVEVESSILLVAFSSQGIGSLQTSNEFRNSLKEHVSVVLGNANSDEELERVMPNVTAQVQDSISKALKNQGSSTEALTAESSQLLIGQITELRHSESRVRQIIRTRLMDFLRQVISHEVARPTQIPGGLSLFKSEITTLAGRFARLVSHNRAVFAQHYADLIQNHCID
nr:EOG090X04Z9 [Eurycercus lamellatus]